MWADDQLVFTVEDFGAVFCAEMASESRKTPGKVSFSLVLGWQSRGPLKKKEGDWKAFSLT